MLSALGLVLLLFYLGLEFHLDDLRSGGRRLPIAGGIYLLLNVGAGLGFGFALGWGHGRRWCSPGYWGSPPPRSSPRSSSTSAASRAGDTLDPGRDRVEDIFLALYLAALQPVISGAQGLTDTVLQAAKAFGFLLVLAAAARYGTRLIGRLMAVRDNELLVVSFLGVTVLVAGVSEVLGVADAIGAFMAGLILAGTPSGPRIRELVHPLRDAFAAIFFLAFGLAIDPGHLASVAGPVAAAAALTVVMNLIAGLLVARLYRYGPGPAADIATTLLARGEFALILAAMATGAGLDDRLAPFIAGYVLVLAVLGPIAAGRAHLLARLLDAAVARLPVRPDPLRTSDGPRPSGPEAATPAPEAGERRAGAATTRSVLPPVAPDCWAATG